MFPPRIEAATLGFAIDTYIYYIHFEFFACSPSLHVGGALANEIKHDHSPVVIVDLDPRYD